MRTIEGGRGGDMDPQGMCQPSTLPFYPNMSKLTKPMCAEKSQNSGDSVPARQDVGEPTVRLMLIKVEAVMLYEQANHIAPLEKGDRDYGNDTVYFLCTSIEASVLLYESICWLPRSYYESSNGAGT